jgi:hypothetical protein
MSGALEIPLEPDAIDRAEAKMAEMPVAVMPVTHRFTPGLYIREILIPKGTMTTSMEHKTTHPFVISHGIVEVISENEGRVIYHAPYTGITDPGTRRIMFAHTDVIWTTFHINPDDENDPEKIGERILVPHENPLLPDDHPRLNQWKNPVTCPVLPQNKDPYLPL